jgi:hypothetical protein
VRVELAEGRLSTQPFNMRRKKAQERASRLRIQRQWAKLGSSCRETNDKEVGRAAAGIEAYNLSCGGEGFRGFFVGKAWEMGFKFGLSGPWHGVAPKLVAAVDIIPTRVTLWSRVRQIRPNMCETGAHRYYGRKGADAEGYTKLWPPPFGGAAMRKVVRCPLRSGQASGSR